MDLLRVQHIPLPLLCPLAISQQYRRHSLGTVLRTDFTHTATPTVLSTHTDTRTSPQSVTIDNSCYSNRARPTADEGCIFFCFCRTFNLLSRVWLCLSTCSIMVPRSKQGCEAYKRNLNYFNFKLEFFPWDYENLNYKLDRNLKLVI